MTDVQRHGHSSVSTMSRDSDRAGNAAAGATHFSSSAMRDFLARDALDRAFLGTNGRSRKRLYHLPRALGIGDPLGIELVWTGRHAAIAVAGVDHAGIAAM